MNRSIYQKGKYKLVGSVTGKMRIGSGRMVANTQYPHRPYRHTNSFRPSINFLANQFCLEVQYPKWDVSWRNLFLISTNPFLRREAIHCHEPETTWTFVTTHICWGKIRNDNFAEHLKVQHACLFITRYWKIILSLWCLIENNEEVNRKVGLGKSQVSCNCLGIKWEVRQSLLQLLGKRKHRITISDSLEKQAEILQSLFSYS